VPLARSSSFRRLHTRPYLLRVIIKMVPGLKHVGKSQSSQDPGRHTDGVEMVPIERQERVQVVDVVVVLEEQGLEQEPSRPRRSTVVCDKHMRGTVISQPKQASSCWPHQGEVPLRQPGVEVGRGACGTERVRAVRHRVGPVGHVVEHVPASY
jgi:hypothetical protein